MARWIAISQAQKAIHTRIGIPEEKISVLYHFYDGPRFNETVPGRDVLFVGRLSAEKGVSILIDAWLQADISDRHLWIVGDRPVRAELEARAGRRWSLQSGKKRLVEFCSNLGRMVCQSLPPGTVRFWSW